MKYFLKILAIAVLALVGIFIVYGRAPIVQDLAYHNFADKRCLCGVNNFADVASNLLFVVFGILGVWFLCKTKSETRGSVRYAMKGEWLVWMVFFVGAVGIGFGSSYYHLNPNNSTLVWDRLPMTVSFMAVFSFIIMERVSEKLGGVLAPFLLVAGASSIVFWQYSMAVGSEDLRPYVLVQFLPLILMPVMLWLFPARYHGVRYIWFTLGWYALAKVLEHYDCEIFGFCNGVVSGHTLKHIAASMGVYTMYLYIKKRKIYS